MAKKFRFPVDARAMTEHATLIEGVNDPVRLGIRMMGRFVADRDRALEDFLNSLPSPSAGGGPFFFDAIVDVLQVTPDPVNHIYPTLAAAIAAESPPADTREMLNIGFKATWAATGDIVEPASTVFGTGSALAFIALFGIGMENEQIWDTGDMGPEWDVNGSYFATNIGVAMYGIALRNDGPTVARFADNDLYLEHCTVDNADDGAGTGGFTALTDTLGGHNFSAVNCGLRNVVMNAPNVHLIDTHVVYSSYAGAPAARLTIGVGSFYMDGGSIMSAAGPIVLAGVEAWMRTVARIDPTNGSGTVVAWSVSSTAGTTYLDIVPENDLSGGYRPDVTVDADAGDTTIAGKWRRIVVNGNNNLKIRNISGISVNGYVDVTGPATLDLDVEFHDFAAPPVTLRGDGVRAFLSVSGGDTPTLDCVGLTNSLVVADLDNPYGLATKAYAIDAGSANCVLVLGGTQGPNHTIASTNAGTLCRVITELSPGPVSIARGTATLVAGTILVNEVTVTATNKILIQLHAPGGIPGFLYVSARVAGTSFTITSTNVADTSQVQWFVLDEPF